MGSFANSLHVKADRSEMVAAAIHDILRDAEWRPTDQPPDPDAPLGMTNGRRGIQVSAPVNGWVGLLDSDVVGITELGATLAEKLSVHTILFLVNDSDSWGYGLVDPSGNVSEHFPDEASDDMDAEELGAMGDQLVNLQQMMQDGSFQQRMQEMTNQMLAAAPPEIRELESRMRTGQATPAEMQRYQAWAMQQFPKVQDQVRAMFGGALGVVGASPTTGKSKPKAQPSRKEKNAARKRLAALRPLFAAGITDEQVQAALDQRAVFAEETLAAFLPLLGIPAHYAYLDYRSLDETTPEELAAHGIRFIHHLKFET
jgi:hypothetical protein